MAITIHWYNETLTAEYAVNLGTDIILYDENYNEINRISQLSYRDVSHISIDGQWTDSSDIPTAEDKTQARIDYLDMEAEALEKSNDTIRADIDYCLMMLDDEVAEA